MAEGSDTLAGGVWPYGDPSAFGATPIDAWAFASECSALGRAVVGEAGISLADGPQKAREQVTPGSREDVALSLVACAELSRMLLSQAVDAKPGSPYAVGAAGGYANMGMLRFMLDSMSRGVTDAAVTGLAVRAGAEAGKSARAAQAERDLMESWGRRALEIAAAIRSSRPGASKAELARRIRQHDQAGGPGLRLPVDDRAITNLLSRHDF